MRFRIGFAILLCIVANAACAQEQERKLMDRLLKPDMSLQNGAQTKQFVATGTPTTKTAPTMTFQFAQKWWGKRFNGVREIRPVEFQTTTSRYQRKEANLGTRNELKETQSRYTTGAYNGVRSAPDAKKSLATSDFDDSSRPFLVQGKSQKSLSAKDEPLTLEQVRELLNKNK
ncbi:MAG: hypothetical protein H0X73_12510 [Chthoniobacterales bacterium]|nr:hypothetical protein [Chthoniobacterales bacterium]